jgi:hypothetical protein
LITIGTKEHATKKTLNFSFFNKAFEVNLHFFRTALIWLLENFLFILILFCIITEAFILNRNFELVWINETNANEMLHTVAHSLDALSSLFDNDLQQNLNFISIITQSNEFQLKHKLICFVCHKKVTAVYSKFLRNFLDKFLKYF